MLKANYEVGIIGGGPAGSSLAAYLANAGISCILLEKEKFPRPHVGESLVPASNRVLSEIGVLEEIDAAGFPRKYGAAWTADGANVYSHDWEGIPDDCKVDIRFDEREMYGDKNYTYHVDRGKFDKILLDHSRSCGAHVLEEALVQKVNFEDGQLPEILYTDKAGKESVRVRLVVDASGRSTKLGSQLKLKIKDSQFDQVAVHTWFEGYERGDDENSDFIFIHFLPISNSWVWQIPISDTVTSFGVVTQKANFREFKDKREAFFWKCVDAHPHISSRLKKADRIRPFTTEGDYSYAMSSFCGNGWALIGDAARFVDPIFSSGVSVALNSARMLFNDIQALYEKEAPASTIKATDLEGYQRVLKNGTRNWYRFISLYYRLNVIFTKYVYDKKYRADILQLLSGDVYDDEYPAVLDEMEKFVKKVEDNDRHLLHPLLGKLRSQAFNPDY